TQVFSTSHGGNPARTLADPVTRPPGEGPRASATSTPETYHTKRGSSAATPAPGRLVPLTRTLPAARVLQHPRLTNILPGLGTPLPASRGGHRCPMRSVLKVPEWGDEPQQSAVAPVGVDRGVTAPLLGAFWRPLHRWSTERRRGAYGTQGPVRHSALGSGRRRESRGEHRRRTGARWWAEQGAFLSVLQALGFGAYPGATSATTSDGDGGSGSEPLIRYQRRPKMCVRHEG